MPVPGYVEVAQVVVEILVPTVNVIPPPPPPPLSNLYRPNPWVQGQFRKIRHMGVNKGD